MKIKSRAEEEWSGLTENSMKDNGEITKCMVRVPLSGLMVEFTQATTSRTKNTVSVLLSGRTEKFMKDTGNRASKMGREKLEGPMVFSEKEYGKMDIEWNDDIKFLYLFILSFTNGIIEFLIQIQSWSI